MKDTRSQGDIRDISWFHMLELMMAKVWQKPTLLKVSYTFGLKERFQIKLLFTDYSNYAVPKLKKKPQVLSFYSYAMLEGDNYNYK